MQKVERSVLETPVEGVNLIIGTLRDQIGREPTLLIFLRHIGCHFGRETIADLQKVSSQSNDYPNIVFVYEGTVAQGHKHLHPLWPDAPFIADPTRYFFQAFGLQRGGIRELFDLPVWVGTVRALFKTKAVLQRSGDFWQMPGAFLIQHDRILWQHHYRHAGNHPAWREVAQKIRCYSPESGVKPRFRRQVYE